MATRELPSLGRRAVETSSGDTRIYIQQTDGVIVEFAADGTVQKWNPNPIISNTLAAPDSPIPALQWDNFGQVGNGVLET
ncbi:hypothetical protein LTR37_019630 [Vermiconidia calcicola]|uniref:Uncharacterized protein n=1 Tax=Vermiconidia calcicola TaxID=1690605 RepID=A0ACC3MGK5_9PEZI|nr:hypothetical protein LTR37_019630 [Vermiconidia calcicola]